jgi:hypothetical protein
MAQVSVIWQATVKRYASGLQPVRERVNGYRYAGLRVAASRSPKGSRLQSNNPTVESLAVAQVFHVAAPV